MASVVVAVWRPYWAGAPSPVGEAALGAAGADAVDAGSAGVGEAGCSPLITAEGLGAAVPVSLPPCSTA
ncbi:hypothetical protein ACSZNU_22400, partial [Aeromonas hydrophila]